jgi:RNAse (barnase) inhibitor barstar
MKKQISIDGNLIHDIPSFFEEINRVFMQSENWKLGASLDAFNDMLYGGFGLIENAEPIDLIWTNINASRQALGHEVTKAYYLGKLKPGSPYNSDFFKTKLAELESGRGETYFDIVISVIAEHPNIHLIAS